MRTLSVLFLAALAINSWSQEISTNRNPVGLEYNLLFYANERFTVQPIQGPSLSVSSLFNGHLGPTYTSTAPTFANPTVVTIEGLPHTHTQAAAWVGWSTRYWPAKNFKIEGYDVHNSANTWRTIADYSDQDYIGDDFVKKIPIKGRYVKLRFTFYEARGANGRLGISELFFIHPEAVARPYHGLLESAKNWKNNGSTLYRDGDLGIGTNNVPFGYKLAVAGKIISTEVKVSEQSNWPDYVFQPTYNLRSLEEVDAYIKTHKHLPGIPTAEEVEAEGVSLGEMNAKLLEKVEELTLYLIELNEIVEHQKQEIEKLKKNQDI